MIFDYFKLLLWGEIPSIDILVIVLLHTSTPFDAHLSLFAKEILGHS